MASLLQPRRVGADYDELTMKTNLATWSIICFTFFGLYNQNGYAIESLDDATILAIFDQANAADIYTARLGVKYGHSDEVRALARQVANDHLMVQQLGRDLAKKLDIFPTPPDNDSSIKAQANSVTNLTSKSGAAFDEAYLHYEFAFHQSVINSIDRTLLPAVKNHELKTLFETVRPGFEHHLAETKATAKALGIKLP